MTEQDTTGYLTGQLLVAMPQMRDPRFQRSVIYMCVHNEQCAMGLVVNRLVDSLSFPDLLQQLNIDADNLRQTIRVHFGGPVERGRGFVLHSADWARDGEGTMKVPGGLEMTATINVLEALASGGGPGKALLALGYSGWGPGQLEAEIARNDWLTCEAPEGLLFAPDDGAKWSAALRGMGIDPLTLSAAAGRA